MLIERLDDAVVVWAPAKVNLFLEVLAKRPDGYHEIATLMVAVSLYDTLEIKEDASAAVQLQCDDPNVPRGADNLVCRAAVLLQERVRPAQQLCGARVRLRKRIPQAAGLAGGSSDAAAALAGLNAFWQLNLSEPELAALGAELGSDIPFFLSGGAAWCTGRGEHAARLTPGRVLWFVLVCPWIHLGTADVYRGVTVPDTPQSGEDICNAFMTGDVAAIGRRLHNRLQDVAERLCPDVALWQARLESLWPAGCCMSGSGPSLFALCHDQRQAQRVARQLRTGWEEESAPRVFLVRSCMRV